MSAALIKGMVDQANLKDLEEELVSMRNQHQMVLAERDTVIEALQHELEAPGAPAQ